MRRRLESILAALGLAALGAAVFGSQVAHGGFYWDDWQNAADVHFAGGFLDAFSQSAQRPVFGYRPVLTELLVLKHSLLDPSKPAEIAAAVGFGVLTAWALYALMRSLRAPRLESAAAAALLLVFPWADSTRIWPTASMDNLAAALFLLGALAAVAGLRRRSWWLAGVSALLYLAAIWTYEVAAAPILASVLLNLAVAPRRAALRRFALDVAVVAVGLAVNLSGTTRRPRPLGDSLDHAWRMTGQLVTLLGRALIPVGSMPGWVGAAVLLLAGAAVLAARVRLPELRRPLALVGLGAAGVAAGYVLYAPAESYYLPLGPGTLTRMNSFGAVGFAALVMGLVSLLARLLGRAPRTQAAVVAAICAAIGAGYVVKVAHDERDWQRAAAEQGRVLAAIRHAAPRPPHGLRIYTFGAPSFAAPGVPVFSLPFDLRSAAELEYDDRTLAAFPIRGRDVIECDAGALHPVGGTYGRFHGAPYGRALFVDVRSGRGIAIRSRGQCLAWRAKLGAAHA